MGKMYFPEEMKQSVIMGICMGQIQLATQSGLKGKDDFIDAISMLGFLVPWRPSDSVPVTEQELERWEEDHPDDGSNSPLASYIV